MDDPKGMAAPGRGHRRYRQVRPNDAGRAAEPTRRWLTYAITPGTPLWPWVELSMHGQIRIGRWRPFTATQILAPPHGYIWAATARMAGLPVTGYDRLSAGTGQMRWRLLHLIPVMTSSGPDITRSACGRLAAEIALIPTAFRHATWAAGELGAATATWNFGNDTETVRFHIGDDGRLTEVLVNRWGKPGGGPIGRYPFKVSVEAETTFAGITIPSRFRAAWHSPSPRPESKNNKKIKNKANSSAPTSPTPPPSVDEPPTIDLTRTIHRFRCPR